MVLKVAVKTLDSQNYQFEAELDWTVTQFKEHIQQTVNVPATEQRLIFCGRVLQNDKKLTEYDCNDKVIHLVRRPPPLPGDESPTRRMAREAQDNLGAHPNLSPRDNMHLEGSFIITATTVETSTNAPRPQATATVFVTSDSGQQGVNIPVTIPLAVNTQSGFPILPASFPMHNLFYQGSNQGVDQRSSRPSQGQPQPQPQPQQQSQSQPQSLSENLRNHPSWVSIIEADVAGMDSVLDMHRCTYFSDAYLSSIPKKRRRMLAATPECIPILHPSPSQAIGNILRRAIEHSGPLAESMDHTVESLANDRDVQEAYEEYIRVAIGSRLESDDDFCPEKYVHTRKYFK